MKIGVFDSGIGGLTFVKELLNLVDDTEIIYFADALHMPYGNKSREYIARRIDVIVNFLESKGAKLIIPACGTVSSVLPNFTRYDKLIGVVEPACLRASELTKNGNIGVIATQLSINEGYYNKVLSNINKKFKIHSKSCSALAEIIESENENSFNKKSFEYISSCILPLKEKNIDTLILGCTHYPVVKNIIKKILVDVEIVDASVETAEFVSKILKKSNKGVSNNIGLNIYTNKINYNFYFNVNRILKFEVPAHIDFVEIK